MGKNAKYHIELELFLKDNRYLYVLYALMFVNIQTVCEDSTLNDAKKISTELVL